MGAGEHEAADWLCSERRGTAVRVKTNARLASAEEQLYQRVAAILEDARTRVVRSVNTTMVHAYWHIGKEIVEVEQRGKARADYGDQLIRRLSERLSDRFGKGYSYPSVKRMKQFYLTFPDGSTIPTDLFDVQKGSAVLSQLAAGKGSAALSQSAMPHTELFPPFLGWTHYQILIRVANAEARAFYEIEAAREVWSSRELERQIGSLLYERLAKSRDKEKVMSLARRGHQVQEPADVIKDPFVLEFLDLPESHTWLERDLEQAIIDRLEDFLLELGKGYCFVARQKRLTLDGDHFYVDLVFYNRLLRCFVLIDLKLGKLEHQDLGQMMMYVNWYDRFQRAEHEQPTVGIVLCSEKNDAVVKITLPHDNKQILAASYQHYLPTEEQLREEVTRSREAVEFRLRMRSEEPLPTTSGDSASAARPRRPARSRKR